MPTALRVLFVADQPSDTDRLVAALLHADLAAAGPGVSYATLQGYPVDGDLDLVLVVNPPSRGEALRVLRWLRERTPDLPLIVLSATGSVDAAVECLKHGATDYLTDEQLPRLGAAVAQAVAQRGQRLAERDATAALRLSEARYRAVAELTADYAYALAVSPDGAISVEWVTDAFSRVTGYTRDELAVVGGWACLVHPNDRAIAERRTRRLLSGVTDVTELHILTREGATRLIRDHGRPVWDATASRVTRIYGAAQDVTERKQWEDALAHRALHDALTDLPNRTLLRDRLRQAILAAQRDHQPMALLLLDLDRFKEVNDAYGHHVGDLLLQHVGQRLRGALRAADTVARIGGDEFAVLLPTANQDGATLAAGKLLHALQQPVEIEAHQLAVGGSIGIALCPEHGEDADTLLRRADVAMYVAKRASSGCAVYTLEQDEHSRGRLALVGELRQAIAEDALAVAYQPIVMQGSEALHVEALVRWPHPRRGLLLPDDFVPLAEQSGLIKPLGPWMLNAALRQCQEWQSAGLDVNVSVNLSMRNLHDPTLPSTIARLLDHWGVEPTWLTVEITESAVMADPDRALEVLARVRDMDVGVAVDDFGTGYSSLSYLKRLPVHILKVDKSFVRDMATNESDARIVHSVVGLGHDLGLRVVAEGVEDAETWEMLIALNCDGVQGNFVGAPFDEAGLHPWLLGAGPVLAGRAQTLSAAATRA